MEDTRADLLRHVCLICGLDNDHTSTGGVRGGGWVREGSEREGGGRESGQMKGDIECEM